MLDDLLFLARDVVRGVGALGLSGTLSRTGGLGLFCVSAVRILVGKHVSGALAGR